MLLAMTPGFYTLPWSAYEAIDAVNHSRLAWFAKSPAYCRLRLDEPLAPSRAMLVGVAAHLAFLEPDSLAEAFAVMRFDGRTKDGRAEREAAEARGAARIDAEDLAAALGMAQSAYTHPRVASLLRSCRAKEETAVWIDPEHRVLCKARRDLAGEGWIAEFKTTANLERFSPWTVTDLGYHRQAAWYLAADAALGRDPPLDFFFVVVESSKPYASAVYRLSDDALELGREEIRSLLRGYLLCSERGEWPRHVEPLLTAEAVKKG